MANYGIHYWFGSPIPCRERFKLIKEAGFSSVTLWWDDEYRATEGEKEKLVAMVNQFGLQIENVHAPYQNANYLWIDSIQAEGLIECYKNCISNCAQFNIPTVVLHLSKGDFPPPPSRVGLNRLNDLIDYAERKDVNIALENLRRPDYLDFVFPKIQSNRLGFCFDSGHQNCYSPQENLLGRYGDRLLALHLHDNDGSDDQHRIPGEGTVNWNGLLEVLDALKYSGPLSLEVTREFSPKYSKVETEEFLKCAYESIDGLVKQNT